MFCSNVLIVAAVAVAVAMVAVVGVVIVIIRSGSSNHAWSRRACFGADANATTSSDRQQKLSTTYIIRRDAPSIR